MWSTGRPMVTVRLVASSAQARGRMCSGRLLAGGMFLALRAARRPSREARRILRSPVAVPVLSIRGSDDGAWSPVDQAHDATFVDAAHSCVVVREAGHFLPEEAPSQVARAIAAHLDELSDTWDCD